MPNWTSILPYHIYRSFERPLFISTSSVYLPLDPISQLDLYVASWIVFHSYKYTTNIQNNNESAEKQTSDPININIVQDVNVCHTAQQERMLKYNTLPSLQAFSSRSKSYSGFRGPRPPPLPEESQLFLGG